MKKYKFKKNAEFPTSIFGAPLDGSFWRYNKTRMLFLPNMNNMMVYLNRTVYSSKVFFPF